MKKIVILTGAGISAESGISVFRGNNGLWENYEIDKVCKVGCLENNRAETIEFYNQRRADLKDKLPNKAHLELSKLKKMYPENITIFTQNVDDLFEKAKVDVIHLHGEVTKIECENCKNVFEIGYKRQEDYFNGICPICKSKKLRPFVVFYGESAPNYSKFNKALQQADLFVLIGSSGEVINVNDIASQIPSILNNLEPSEAIDDTLFKKVYYEKATIAIDKIIKDIKELISNPFIEFFELLRENFEINEFKEFSVNKNVIDKFKKGNFLDSFAVFIEGEVDNILINDENISQQAKKIDIPFEVLKDFIKIYIYSSLITQNKKENFSILIALKMYQNRKYFTNLENFVEKLGFSYKEEWKFLAINDIFEALTK